MVFLKSGRPFFIFKTSFQFELSQRTLKIETPVPFTQKFGVDNNGITCP